MKRFGGEIISSPYSLIELDLLVKSDIITISDTEAFYSALNSLLKYRGIKTLSPKPTYHAKAFNLRKRYRRLTYFDSLHAGAAITEGLELISYDRIYANIDGLKYIPPTHYLERR